MSDDIKPKITEKDQKDQKETEETENKPNEESDDKNIMIKVVDMVYLIGFISLGR